MSKKWGKLEIQRITSADGVIHATPHVVQVFNGLSTGKQLRAQREIIAQLEAIHCRVQAALKHFGIGGSANMTEEELKEEELRKRRPPGYLTSKMKQDMLNKQMIMDTIHEFTQTCLSCERNMEEVNDWLYDVQITLENNMVSEDVMKERAKEIIDINQDCSQVWADGKKQSRRHADKLRRLGREIFQVLNDLIRESNADDSDDEDANSSHHMTGEHPINKLANLKKKVKAQHLQNLDENVIKEIENWKSAAKDVDTSLENACRWARTNNDRTTMRNAVKKFNFITMAMERRNSENMQQGQQILDCEVKINHVTKVNERLDVDSKKKAQRLETAESIIKKANTKISELQTKVKETKMEAAEFKNKFEEAVSSSMQDVPPPRIKELENEKNEAMKKIREQETLITEMAEKHKIEVEEIDAKYKDEEDTARKLEKVIGNLEAELRESLQLQEEYAHQLDLAEYQKMDGKSKSDSLREQYKNQVKDLKKDLDDLHRELTHQKAEVDAKEVFIEKQELKIGDLNRQVKDFQKAPKAKEAVMSNDTQVQFRQRLTSIKGGFQQEIDKLKDHLDKERNRSLAEKRRQDQDIKMQLLSIHKESVHLMRSINRFKESIASILEREGLLDTAHEIRQMENLVIEEKSSDMRRALNHMSGGATEMLVSLEIKIAQALMNKRIELKEALIAKVKAPATPPTADGSIEVDKLHQENQQLQDRILKYHDQMNAAQVSFEEMKRINEEKYNALLERHKAQILQASNLQRELRSLEAAFREEIKKRDAKLRNMKVSAAEQQRNQQVLVSRLNSVEENPRPALKKPNVEQMRMKVGDQMKNLSMLDEAFKENKISLELHTITVDIINQTMEVPELRLRSLFERYITFRRLQEQKDQLFDKISDDNTKESGKDQHLVSFLQRMEKRYGESINKWRDKREILKKQRTQLYEQMLAIFDAVTQEAGISMIRPQTATFRPYKPPSRRRKLNIRSSAVHMEVPHAMNQESVIGTSMALLGEPGPFWRMPANWEATTALVTVPRMLDMDVNVRRKAAQDVLLRLGKGDVMRNLQCSRETREPSLPPIATLFPPISS